MILIQRCWWCGDLATDVVDDVYVCEKHKGLQLNTDN